MLVIVIIIVVVIVVVGGGFVVSRDGHVVVGIKSLGFGGGSEFVDDSIAVGLIHTILCVIINNICSICGDVVTTPAAWWVVGVLWLSAWVFMLLFGTIIIVIAV